jgi:hypothetical protein
MSCEDGVVPSRVASVGHVALDNVGWGSSHTCGTRDLKVWHVRLPSVSCHLSWLRTHPALAGVGELLSL